MGEEIFLKNFLVRNVFFPQELFDLSNPKISWKKIPYGGVKYFGFLGKEKTFLTRKCFRKIPSPKISSGKKSSNTPRRGNFRAQNFLETRGNFTRKFLNHLIIELKSVQDEAYPFPVLDDAYCCTYTRLCSLLRTHTCIESHKRCPKRLDERAGQDCCTRWNDD